MRILRILEYVGSKEFIRSSLESRGVKGAHYVLGGVIREGFVGDIPLLGLSKFDEDREPEDRQQGIVADKRG